MYISAIIIKMIIIKIYIMKNIEVREIIDM